MIEASQIAWAGGLFEGEGTMTLNGVSRSPRVKLSMVDRDVVKKFADIIGGGNYFEHHVKNPKHKINSLGMHRQRQKLYE